MLRNKKAFYNLKNIATLFSKIELIEEDLEIIYKDLSKEYKKALKKTSMPKVQRIRDSKPFINYYKNRIKNIKKIFEI